MNGPRLEAERKLWARQRRAWIAPLWVCVAGFALGAVREMNIALSLADSYGISLDRALVLLRVKGSMPLGRSYPGYELAFIRHTVTAIESLVVSIQIAMLIVLHRKLLRSQARIWEYIDELERGASHKAEHEG